MYQLNEIAKEINFDCARSVGAGGIGRYFFYKSHLSYEQNLFVFARGELLQHVS